VASLGEMADENQNTVCQELPLYPYSLFTIRQHAGEQLGYGVQCIIVSHPRGNKRICHVFVGVFDQPRHESRMPVSLLAEAAASPVSSLGICIQSQSIAALYVEQLER
jgi:hypothetical protein